MNEIERAIEMHHRLTDNLNSKTFAEYRETVLKALRAQQERENPKPLTDVLPGNGGRWGKCPKCGKLNRCEYNYCAGCGTRIYPPKEEKC